MTSAIESLLSPEQIADATGMHYQTVLDLCRRGELPALKIGNRWKIRPGDYDAWLESLRVAPRPPADRAAGGSRLRVVRPRAAGPGSLARLAEIEGRS